MPKTGPKRDLEAEERILSATRGLICTKGPGQVTINEIAAEALVGKQTIYRWWPSKSALVIDALERLFEDENPFPETGTAKEDVRIQMRRVAKMFSSPTGSIIRELVAESQGDPAVAEQFRVRFFAERRLRAAAALQAGVDRGQVRDGLDIEAAIDMLYAPLWLRMLIGHQPLSQRSVDTILDQAWPALGSPPLAPSASS
ncbi:MAG: AcrR family transcriptional regulator [Acidimicrobiales bacterium]|jgi:AcrR family transcriptional regulator